MSKRKLYTHTFVFILAALAFMNFASCSKSEDQIIKVGILHSKTGNMANSEKAVMQAELLAIEELNASGGVLGHEIVPVIEDGEPS